MFVPHVEVMGSMDIWQAAFSGLLIGFLACGAVALAAHERMPKPGVGVWCRVIRSKSTATADRRVFEVYRDGTRLGEIRRSDVFGWAFVVGGRVEYTADELEGVLEWINRG